ncbi:hypothetical protein COCON_G00008810 [Conger conger]|uniref:Uncharacterized protein n=1 Tax=Conger conger TaxID=82655 RepID=A0A9Q1I727_CONCO|nr:hypothetical protein COCON_G00008810 [Conger conger]
MRPIQCLSLLTVFCVRKVESPPIQEEFEDYRCLGGMEKILHNSTALNISGCEQMWEFGELSIADLHREQCVWPCLNVSSGEIHLAQCVNVSLTILCSGKDHIEESRTHFRGMPSSSQGEHSTKEQNHHIGLIPFAVCAVGAVGAVGLFRKCRP